MKISNLKTMIKLSFDWSNATSPERRDIIFQDRNKKYGGYVIRKNYDRHVVYALLITLLSIGLAVVIPSIVSHYTNKIPEISSRMTEQIKLINPVEFQKLNIQTTPVSHANVVRTEKFDIPKIVDRVDNNENIKTQDQINESTAGTTSTTQTGNIELPAEPVETIDTVTPRIFADIMPVFPGGDEKLLSYLSKIKYPMRAKEENISGMVYISFVIDTDGKIKDVKLLRGIFADCDEEALRVVRGMPSWIPGKVNGVNVPVLFRLPVNFKLR
jgi:protein TonB